jgi:hypothetical protein
MNQTPKEDLMAKLRAMGPRARIALLEMAARKREEKPVEQNPDDLSVGTALK